MEEERTKYVVFCKYCDWKKEMEFTCPQCHKPFCGEDHEQATRTAIVAHLHSMETIEKLKGVVNNLQEELDLLKERVYSCKDFKTTSNVVPKYSWTEAKILDWITDNQIPIDYKPSRDTKAWVLEEINKLGY